MARERVGTRQSEKLARIGRIGRSLIGVLLVHASIGAWRDRKGVIHNVQWHHIAHPSAATPARPVAPRAAFSPMRPRMDIGCLCPLQPPLRPHTSFPLSLSP